MSVRILHAADFHLDSPYSSLTEEKAALRRQEARELLGRLAALIEKEKAQILLLSGDLFDSSASYWETQEMLTKMLSGVNIPVFIAPGNHDYYSPRSPYSFMELPENVHIFRTPSVKCVELPELGVRVWGAGFTSPVCDSILDGFTTGASDMVDIMVLHGELGGDRYNPITEDEIAASGLDYLALGHIHTFSGIRKAGATHYAYPGCLEGRGFDETGAKGVISGTVEKGKCDLRFIPVEGRRYEVISVDLTGCDSAEDAVLAAIGDGAPDNIVRIVLKGEYSGDVDKERIASLLDDKFWSVTVKNETVAARGIWDGADEDSLTGLFLSHLKEKYDSATDDREREKCIQAARYGIAALENREVWRP